MIDNRKTFTYYHPIAVRYADLDPQGHVNNAMYLTYLESARLGYYEKVRIWKMDFGMITGFLVAYNEINYLASITLGQSLRVGLRVARLGTKSLTFEFRMETAPEYKEMANGKFVMVAYDNDAGRSIPIPLEWRENIVEFEKMEGNDEPA